MQIRQSHDCLRAFITQSGIQQPDTGVPPRALYRRASDCRLDVIARDFNMAASKPLGYQQSKFSDPETGRTGTLARREEPRLCWLSCSSAASSTALMAAGDDQRTDSPLWLSMFHSSFHLWATDVLNVTMRSAEACNRHALERSTSCHQAVQA